MLVAKEAVVGREGRGVCRREHEVLGAVNEGSFLLCISPPKDEDEVLALFGQAANGGIGKGFPSLALVRAGLMGLYGERGIE